MKLTRRLIQKILENLPEAQVYEMDGYKVYENLPVNRYIVRKKKGGRINRNENLHSKLRSYLA